MPRTRELLNRPIAFTPTRVFFTSGAGVHELQRVAMQHAMTEAGVGDFNLVKVSSVIAPRCEVITAQRGIRLLTPGSIAFAVIAQGETSEPHQRVTVALTWGQPADDTLPGYITEVEEEQANGKSEKTATDEAGEALVTMFADRMGVKADAKRIWGNRGRNRTIRVGRQPIRVGSIVSSSVGMEMQGEKPRNTVVFAAAIFL